jgi:hypothetical protein
LAEDRLYGIPARVKALRARYQHKDARNNEVQAVRRGDFEAIAPDLFSEQFSRPIVANLIDTTARDVAAVLAPLPSFSCSSPNMSSERSKDFATKRTRIVRNYLDFSQVEWQMLTGADQYNSYGMIVTTVTPDFKNKQPYILFESAVGAYPVWDHKGECTEFARVYYRDWFAVVADYPNVENVRKSFPHALGTNNKVEIVKYINKDRILVYIPSMGDLILEDMPNPMKRCIVVCTRRPGLDDEIRGAYDDVIWVQFARHRLQALLLEGVDKAVRAPLVIPDDANEVALGPDAVIRTRQGAGSVARARLDMPAQAFSAVEQLKQEQMLGAMAPEARSGSMDASVITGRGVQQLMAGFSAQIAAAQLVFRTHFKRVIELAFAMDEELWPDEPKDIRGNDSGVPYSFTYRAAKDIDNDHTVDISYGFAAGLDPNRALVFLLQADGAGLVSKDYVRRNIPVDLNAVEEERKIFTEQSRAALVQAFSALTQSIPQLIAAGQDASQIIATQAKFISLIQKGMSVEAAVMEVLKPPEPPPGASSPGPDQAATPGGPGDGSAPGGPGGAEGFGPNGLPSGMALGQASQGPGARPPLQMFMAGLNGAGNPNMAAAVSRQNPVVNG